jgi:hypothetical protein
MERGKKEQIKQGDSNNVLSALHCTYILLSLLSYFEMCKSACHHE